MNLQDILTGHFSRYPMMRPQDALKLLYQAEFGPGHLLRDESRVRQRLREEMAALTPDAGEMLYELVGGGLCRLSLRACLARGVAEETVFSLLSETARTAHGEKARFLSSLRLVTELAEEDEAPFDFAEWETYLAYYDMKKCPAVHHSEAYRAAYQPAYRVVSQHKLKVALKQMRQAENRPAGA